MKNAMMYLIWFSSCRDQSESFYESVHPFLIGIVVRVAISSNLILVAFVLGKLGDRQARKLEEYIKVEQKGCDESDDCEIEMEQHNKDEKEEM
jgi:hypothetical protein